MFCRYEKRFYLCTRNLKTTSLLFGFARHFGPFVYRLGRKIFILEGGVRFPYGLLQKKDITVKQKWQIINQQKRESDRRTLVA